MNTPVTLVILDGWGQGKPCRYNAIHHASTPNMDRFMAEGAHTTLAASGEEVGLPPGQMGNSEVGHLNIGCGRIVRQSLSRITHAIEDGSFFENPALLAAVNRAKEPGKALHLMGLLSDGGVHSHMDHLKGLLELAARHEVEQVFVHAILDGRDTPPQSALSFIEELEHTFHTMHTGTLASLCGRYYAMDRDNRWGRTRYAYETLTGNEPARAATAAHAVEASYAKGDTDEFFEPLLIEGTEGAIHDGDAVIFFNFRPDRARQITRAFVDDDFTGFPREKRDTLFVCMTEYDADIKGVPVAFGPITPERPLGAVLAEAGRTQLRIAETEKYAHVTFFFNGGVEAESPGETRILIPSPKVATYDLKPEMSAAELTDAFVERFTATPDDLTVLNFANADMVGHTGDMKAAVKALEAVDECLGRVVTAATANGGAVLITADHGNAETMVDPITGNPMTAHTTNPVPLILLGSDTPSLRDEGRLCDIAPTILSLLGIPQPEEMTGQSLLA